MAKDNVVQRHTEISWLWFFKTATMFTVHFPLLRHSSEINTDGGCGRGWCGEHI